MQAVGDNEHTRNTAAGRLLVAAVSAADAKAVALLFEEFGYKFAALENSGTTGSQAMHTVVKYFIRERRDKYRAILELLLKHGVTHPVLPLSRVCIRVHFLSVAVCIRLCSSCLFFLVLCTSDVG